MDDKGRQKRIYGVGVNIRLLDDFIMNTRSLKQAKKTGSVGKAFGKRIMLAVTQVNGCVMCAYHHTEQALKMGMDADEVRHILGGEFGDVPNGELNALLFAQHYADTTGRPGEEAWQRVVSEYGQVRAQHIKSFIRAIMVGNAQGNIIGALKSRFAGKPEQGSTFFKEVSVLAADVVVMPFILLKSLVLMPFRSKHRQA